MPEEGVKKMSIGEFQDLGFLQEANRLFFHRVGLALEIVTEVCERCNGSGCEQCYGRGVVRARLGGIWDYREDPEGIVYSPDYMDMDKATSVEGQRLFHLANRQPPEFTLYGIQKIPNSDREAH